MSNVCFPTSAEELLHEGATLSFEHAGRDLYTMIQRPRLADMKLCVYGPGAFVACAVDEPPDPRLDERARAHRAGLDGRINCCARQPVVSKNLRRFTQGDDFGMSRRVAIRARAIPRDREKSIARHDARADGHFAALLRVTRSR
jgi:hypothetical protein